MITDTVLIIPAYNEGQVIRQVIENAKETFKYVIVVNDGSSDNTSFEAKSGGADVVEHFMNGGGQGGAIQTGIEYAIKLPVKYFVTFDADGQHRVEDVISMREKMLSDDYDIILGSRFLGLKPDNMPISKRILLKLAISFSNFTTGLKLTDTHNGLRLFNRHVAETIDITETGYQHASEIIEKIKQHNYKYVEEPMVVIYTDYSMAKGQSMLNAVNIGMDIILRKVIGK